jgi:hypothetical protein
MIRKTTFIKCMLASIVSLFVASQTSVGQTVKKIPAKTAAVKPAKGPVKATITADMDCTVKITGVAKPTTGNIEYRG